GNATLPDYFVWKEQNRSFESIAAAIADQKNFGAGEDGLPPERLVGQGVSPELFQILGVSPLLGRVFTEAEDQIDRPSPVIVLSYRLWQRRFGGDPNILNRQIRLSGVSTTVIGIMPESFVYPI